MIRLVSTFALLLSAMLPTASTVTADKPIDVIIDDSDRFSPSEVISSNSQTDADAPTTWQKVIDAKSPSGWRLQTTIKTKAPDLVLPLDVKGPHEIYIGVYMPDTLTSGVLVRSDDDPYFHYIKGFCNEKYPAYHQTLYKVADCTGRKLIFRQPAEMRSYITHVRLVPCDKVPKLSAATREVLGMSCTFHHFYFYPQNKTADTAASIVRAHELNGLTEMVFCCGRSCLTYETKVGTPHRIEPMRTRTRYLAMASSEDTPLADTIKAAQHVGIKLSGRLSMNCHYHGSYDNKLTGEFVLKNPHFHDKRRNGSVDYHKLCYGYPEVRAERVAIFREIVELGCDHLFVDCRRYMPMTQWGDPLVEGFEKKYGTDPRKLKNTDKLWPKWLRYRASFFTQVLQDTKKMLAKIGREDVSVTIRVNAETLAKNLEHGAEIDRFVKEGLVDRIVLGEKDSRPVAKEYLDLVRGTHVKVIGCLSVHGRPMAGPEHHSKGNWPSAMYLTPDYAQYAKVVDDLYEMGVHGMAFYETDEGCLYPRMRDFFIACRRPETIKIYRHKMERNGQIKVAKAFSGFTFKHKTIPAVKASVSSIDDNPKYKIENILDGDFSTHFIADRACCDPDGPGCAITLTFDNPTQIDKLAFLCLRRGDSIWAPRECKVQYHDGTNWQDVSAKPIRDNTSHIIKLHFESITTSKLRVQLKDVRVGAHNPAIVELTWE